MMSQYKRNVNDSLSSMNKAMQTAYDYRAFDRPSDNPLAAAQTFQVQWETNLNGDYQTNVSNLKSAVNTADSILQNIDSILTNASSTSVLKGITGTTSDSGRESIAKEILAYRDTIVSEMNSKYADSYLFGGSNSSDVPFTVQNDKLYYRGIDVDTGENLNGASETLSYTYGSGPDAVTKNMQINFGTAVGKKLNGYKMNIQVSGTATDISTNTDTSAKTITVTVPEGTKKGDLQSYFEGTYAGATANAFSTSLTTIDSTITAADAAEMVKGITISGLPDNKDDAVVSTAPDASTAGITDVVDLSKLAGESIYVDIGLGITANGGNINAQSAFDSSMPGIAYLGYGTSDVTNEDGSVTTGVPNNIFSLLTTIAADLRDSNLVGNSLVTAVDPYITNFTNTQEKFEAKQTEIGSKLQLLGDTQNYLQNMGTSLDEKDDQVEFVDVTDAITNYYMQQYCYQASLKVGGQTIQQSLMDYLK